MTMKTLRLDRVLSQTSRREVKYTQKKSCRSMTGMKHYYAQEPASRQGNAGNYDVIKRINLLICCQLGDYLTYR